jgi:universal stress protein E
MDKISQVLCVVDPAAETQPALQRAASVARNAGAELELFLCYYNEYLTGDRLLDASAIEAARQEVLAGYEGFLEKLAAPLRDTGLVVRATAIWDHPLYQGIVRHAAAIGADLVFKDTHHHTAIARALLSHTDWSLIRNCASPLWLVKDRELKRKPVLIAAIDPMNEHDKPAALDDEIMVLAEKIAGISGGEVHAFHSYDPRLAVATATANAYVPVSLPLDEIEKEMRKQHKQRFDEMTEFHEIPASRSHLVAGQAHEELPRLAEELDAAVVVMGAVGRNPLQRLFIGSTAERTLDRLPCDLLIVKPPWFHTRQDLDAD